MRTQILLPKVLNLLPKLFSALMLCCLLLVAGCDQANIKEPTAAGETIKKKSYTPKNYTPLNTDGEIIIHSDRGLYVNNVWVPLKNGRVLVDAFNSKDSNDASTLIYVTPDQTYCISDGFGHEICNYIASFTANDMAGDWYLTYNGSFTTNSMSCFWGKQNAGQVDSGCFNTFSNGGSTTGSTTPSVSVAYNEGNYGHIAGLNWREWSLSSTGTITQCTWHLSNYQTVNSCFPYYTEVSIDSNGNYTYANYNTIPVSVDVTFSNGTSTTQSISPPLPKNTEW